MRYWISLVISLFSITFVFSQPPMRKIKINIFTDPTNAGFGKSDHDPNVIEVNLDLSKNNQKANDTNKEPKAKLMKLPNGQLVKVEVLHDVPDDMKNAPILEMNSNLGFLGPSSKKTRPSLANIAIGSRYRKPKRPKYYKPNPFFMANIGEPSDMDGILPYAMLEANLGPSDFMSDNFASPNSEDNPEPYQEADNKFPLVSIDAGGTGNPDGGYQGDKFPTDNPSNDPYPLINLNANMFGYPYEKSDKEPENTFANANRTAVDVRLNQIQMPERYSNTSKIDHNSLLDVALVPFSGHGSNLTANVILNPLNKLPERNANDQHHPGNNRIVDIVANTNGLSPLIKTIPSLEVATHLQNPLGMPPTRQKADQRLLGLF